MIHAEGWAGPLGLPSTLFWPGVVAPACPSLSPKHAHCRKNSCPSKDFQTGPFAKRCEARLVSVDAAPMPCMWFLSSDPWPSQEVVRIRDTVQAGAPQMGRARQGLMPGNGKMGVTLELWREGGSGPFWAVPESLPGEERSSEWKQVGPRSKQVYRATGRLQLAGGPGDTRSPG